jgi:hypothetical protein
MWLAGTRDEKLLVWSWTGWHLGMGNEIGASGDSLQYRVQSYPAEWCMDLRRRPLTGWKLASCG